MQLRIRKKVCCCCPVFCLPKSHKRKFPANIWEEEGSSDSDEPPNGYPELLESSDEDGNESQTESSSDAESNHNNPKPIHTRIKDWEEMTKGHKHTQIKEEQQSDSDSSGPRNMLHSSGEESPSTKQDNLPKSNKHTKK